MKKMRRMIPALCMLLVSAIMLSTASYAWFTMNESVTATGMQVQAQAGGSMVIGKEPLYAESKNMDVGFANEGTKKLAPVSYFWGEGWKTPNQPADVDPTTGSYSGDYTEGSVFGESNYMEYTVYIAVSGDSIERNIEATLTTTSELPIKGAYAVAFYVDKATIDATTVPDLILHVDEGQTIAGNENTDHAESISSGNLFDAARWIPSTVGYDTPSVGIKVTMRVFIDGNLQTGNMYTPLIPNYPSAKNTQYDKATTYYVQVSDGVYELAPVENTYTQDQTITDDWYTYAGMIADPNEDHKMPIHYVRNESAPEAPTGLNVKFTLVDETTSAQG